MLSSKPSLPRSAFRCLVSFFSNLARRSIRSSSLISSAISRVLTSSLRIALPLFPLSSKFCAFSAFLSLLMLYYTPQLNYKPDIFYGLLRVCQAEVRFNNFLFILLLLVMNRQAILICRAARLQHKLFISLPFTARFATFARIALDPREIFGRMAYTVFLQRKIEGMPDIHGQPALGFDLSRAPQHLAPQGYGKEFGAKVMNLMLYKYKDPEMVQDAMQNAVVKLLQEANKLREGASLSDAQGYVVTIVKNECLGIIRHRNKHPGDYGQGMPSADEDAPAVELEDPHALKAILQWIDDESGGTAIQHIMQDLQKIKGAVPFVQGKLETGLSNQQLVGNLPQGITPKYPWFQENPISYGNFTVNVLPKIKRVFRKYVNELHT